MVRIFLKYHGHLSRSRSNINVTIWWGMLGWGGHIFATQTRSYLSINNQESEISMPDLSDSGFLVCRQVQFPMSLVRGQVNMGAIKTN